MALPVVVTGVILAAWLWPSWPMLLSLQPSMHTMIVFCLILVPSNPGWRATEEDAEAEIEDTLVRTKTDIGRDAEGIYFPDPKNQAAEALIETIDPTLKKAKYTRKRVAANKQDQSQVDFSQPASIPIVGSPSSHPSHPNSVRVMAEQDQYFAHVGRQFDDSQLGPEEDNSVLGEAEEAARARTRPSRGQGATLLSLGLSRA